MKYKGFLAPVLTVIGVGASLWFLGDSAILASRWAVAGRPAAVLLQGEVMRRSTGSTGFVPAAETSRFQDLDYIWSLSERQAVLRLRSGAKVSLQPGELIQLNADGTTRKIDPNYRFAEFPQADLAESREVAEAEKKFAPPPRALIYSRASNALEVPFSWIEPFTGYLVARDREGKRTHYSELKPAKQALLELMQGQVYHWHLIDAEKKVLAGPFVLELRPLQGADMKKIVAEQKKRPVQVYW